MVDVQLRRISEDEWRALCDLRLRALSDSPNSFGSTYEREYRYSENDWREWAREAAAGRTETTVLAWQDDDAIGMVGAYVEDGSDHAHLIAMWVAPNVRRRGVGEMLVDAIVSWATETGLGSVRLDVVEGNSGASRLYERCGFTPTGRSRRYDDRPQLVCVELELELT
jgi:ribosomal protein S18 acetylase RimI-like enzyme